MVKKSSYLIPIVLVILSLCVSFLSASKIFEFQPTTTDENAYTFQSKLFLNGMVAAKPPLLKDFFSAEQIVLGDKWFSRYSPGHSLVLMPGVWFDFVNLIPIILSALMILVVYLFLLDLTKNIVVSFLGACAAILSPFFIFMSGTYLSHTSCSFFVLLYMFLFYNTAENKLSNMHSSVILGIIWSFAFIIRQYSCVLITMPFVLYHLYLSIKYKKFKSIVFFGIGCIPFFVFQLLYNYICTGNPFAQTYSYYDPSQKLGFGLRFYEVFDFTPQVALLQLKTNLFLLDSWLFGVPCSLVVLMLLVILSNNDVWKRLFITSIFALICGYFFFFFQGLRVVGPNYYYDIFPIIIILFFKSLYSVCKNKKMIWAGVLLSMFVCYFVFYSNFMKQAIKDIKKHMENYSAVRNIVRDKKIHNAIIFVHDGDRYVRNSPFLDDDVLIVNDRQHGNLQLMLYYPDRKYYKYYYDEEKMEGYLEGIYFKEPHNYVCRFNGSFNNSTGKRISVPCSDKYMVYGRKATDKPDMLLYGPYWYFPAGEYICVFTLRVNRAEKGSEIVKLDIVVDYGREVLKEKILIQDDFPRNNIYYDFPLRFSLKQPAKIESRVYYYGNADVLVKQVRFIQE